MAGPRPAVARYRSRGTFRQRWGGYLSLGPCSSAWSAGLALGALASARRTQSSYSTYLASTNPSDLSLGTALYNPALGFTTGYDAAFVRSDCAPTPRHPVSRATAQSTVHRFSRTDQPTSAAYNANVNVNGSIDGEFFNQDRVTVVTGRMADPGAPTS